MFDPRISTNSKKIATAANLTSFPASNNPVHNTAEAWLKLRNLRVQFLTADASLNFVNYVSFTVQAGKPLAVAGECVLAKTVTALTIMQLAVPGFTNMQGSVRNTWRFGVPDAESHLIHGSEMAMIFPKPITAFNPVLTIGFQMS